MTQAPNCTRVSIVVCAYNEAGVIENCLNSLLTLRYPANCIELVIIDDGSSDGTREAVVEWAERRTARFPIRYYGIEHAGLSVARNTGVEHSRCPMIAFIDADASAERDWLCHLTRQFDQKPWINIVAGRVENGVSPSWLGEMIFLAHFRAAAKAARDIPLVGANMAFRRGSLLGGQCFFDVFMQRGDETSLYVDHVSKAGGPIATYADDAVVYNEHPSTMGVWARQQILEGRMGALIDLNIRSRGAPNAAQIVRLLVRTGAVIWYVSIPAALLGWQILFLLSLPVWVVRHIQATAYIKVGMTEVRKALGLRASMVAPLLSVASILLRDMGNVLEHLRYLRGRRLCLSRTVGEVNERIVFRGYDDWAENESP